MLVVFAKNFFFSLPTMQHKSDLTRHEYKLKASTDVPPQRVERAAKGPVPSSESLCVASDAVYCEEVEESVGTKGLSVVVDTVGAPMCTHTHAEGKKPGSFDVVP